MHRFTRDLWKKVGIGPADGYLYDVGHAFLSRGDFKGAIAHYKMHLNQEGNRMKARDYCNLGHAYLGLSDFRQAIYYYQTHLEIAKRKGEKAVEGRAYCNLGNAFLGLGDFRTAIDYYEMHLDIAIEVGDKAVVGSAYCSLGNAFLDLGDFRKAIDYHEKHLKITKEVGDKAGESSAYGNLCNASLGLGDFRKAINYWETHLKIAKEEGGKAGKRCVYGNLGNAFRGLGDFRKAIKYYEIRLKIAKEKGDKAGEGEAYSNLGNSLLSLGDFKKAIEFYEMHFKIAKEVGHTVKGSAYGNIGHAFLGLGDFRKAIDYYKSYLKIAKEIRDKAGEGEAYGNLGNACQRLGDFKQAIEYYLQHLSIAKELGNRIDEGHACGDLANAYQNLEDFKNARHYHDQRLVIDKELEHSTVGGLAYGNPDVAYQNLGYLKQVTEYLTQRLSFGKELGNNAGEKQLHVPPEVRTRGALAVEVYNNALAEGETLVKRLPLMLIGQAEAGKTSLKKSLNGVCFNSEEERTVGIDVDPSHFKLTKEIWKVGEKDQEVNAEMAISFEHQAARCIAHDIKEKGRDSEKKRAHVTSEKSYGYVSFEPAITVIPAMTEAPLSEPPKGSDQIQTSEHSAGPTSASEDSPRPTSAPEDSAGPIPDDITAFTPSEQEFEEIAALAETLLQDGGFENGDVYSMLWDFAGQSVYYVTHVLFLTGRAIYFLVYDLSQNPHDTAKPRVKQGVYKKFADKSNLKTNLDYLDLWMASVASLASQGEGIAPKSEVLPKKLPAVFLVCTHADKPHGGRDPREMANEIFGCLKKKSYGDHLHDVFCVDNTKSGSESECPEVMRLREEVLAVSNELPYMNEEIPIKWLKYEKALRMMLESGYKWISLDKAKHVASKVCKINKDDEVLTLLNFLHDLRILIHFDDSPELNQLVVLDPQWLIDLFKKVITVKPRHKWKEKKFEDLWCKLEGEGILDEDLVKHVWSDLNNQKETLEGLISIMEKFGLLCPCPSSHDLCSKQYLVPSMLKSHPPEAIMMLAASAQVPSLFVKFESGQVPAGLFPRLVLQFYHWGKEKFWIPGNPKLYQDFARFFISGDIKGCSVILRCHSSSIEILYHSVGDNTVSFTFTRTVRRQIGLILECMRNQLCWLNNMKYQMSVICPVCCEGNAVVHCEMHDEQSCKQEECLHFWSESELCGSKKSISCTRYAFAVDTTVDAKVGAPWFTFSAEQVANGKHDERLSSSYETNEENALALPGGHQFLESILADSCDPKELVNRLSEKLEQLSLTEPDPNTKKLVRCLARKANCSNRLDVVKHLRDITPAGTTGPLLPENLQVQRIPFEQRRRLTISLSGGDEWKLVAERLDLTHEEIRFLDKRTLNPAEAMLGHVAQLRSTTVGDLYDLLVDCGLPVMADTL